MASKREVAVLIGDITKSKAIPAHKRYALQKKLANALKTVSFTFKNELFSPLALTLGDEFQSVGASLLSMWRIVRALEIEVKPLNCELRYALAEGPLYTPLNRKEPLKMDGPAFWKARELMSTKKSKYMVALKTPLLDPTLNVHGRVLQDIETHWSSVQGRYVHYALAHPEATMDGIARRFRKNPSTISRTMKSAKYMLYLAVLGDMDRLLKERR